MGIELAANPRVIVQIALCFFFFLDEAAHRTFALSPFPAADPSQTLVCPVYNRCALAVFAYI